MTQLKALDAKSNQMLKYKKKFLESAAEMENLKRAVKKERTFSQVRSIDLPYTEMNSSSGQETKLHKEWRDSKDIRPRGWEKHKETKAMHERAWSNVLSP